MYITEGNNAMQELYGCTGSNPNFFEPFRDYRKERQSAAPGSGQRRDASGTGCSVPIAGPTALRPRHVRTSQQPEQPWRSVCPLHSSENWFLLWEFSDTVPTAEFSPALQASRKWE